MRPHIWQRYAAEHCPHLLGPIQPDFLHCLEEAPSFRKVLYSLITYRWRDLGEGGRAQWRVLFDLLTAPGPAREIMTDFLWESLLSSPNLELPQVAALLEAMSERCAKERSGGEPSYSARGPSYPKRVSPARSHRYVLVLTPSSHFLSSQEKRRAARRAARREARRRTADEEKKPTETKSVQESAAKVGAHPSSLLWGTGHACDATLLC